MIGGKRLAIAVSFRPLIFSSAMPRPSSQVLALAKIGAEHRHRELRDELIALEKQFTHLRTSAARAQRSAPAAKPNANDAGTPVRRRRRMSAAARKRISEAQKARWAARRKAKA